MLSYEGIVLSALHISPNVLPIITLLLSPWPIQVLEFDKLPEVTKQQEYDRARIWIQAVWLLWNKKIIRPFAGFPSLGRGSSSNGSPVPRSPQSGEGNWRFCSWVWCSGPSPVWWVTKNTICPIHIYGSIKWPSKSSSKSLQTKVKSAKCLGLENNGGIDCVSAVGKDKSKTSQFST